MTSDALRLARARAVVTRVGERLLEDEAEHLLPRGLNALSGHALALRAIAQATGEPRFAEGAHAALRAAAAASDQPLSGLFSGLSGLRAAAAIFAAGDPRYGKLAAQCDAHVEASLPAASPARVRSLDEYDLLSGWSGMRVARCITGARGPDRTSDLLGGLLVDEERWAAPHPLRPQSPGENDLGMAHGIAGVLATLALTVDPLSDELRERLCRQARWLAARAEMVDGVMSFRRYAQAGPQERAAPTWCYGTPGVAAALYWVGSRAGEPGLEEFALNALRGIAALPYAAWGHRDLALCHGTLGNAIVFASVGRASGCEMLSTAALRCADRALDELEKSAGICWGCRPNQTGDAFVRADLAGQLDGAAGVALALLAITGLADSSWLLCHGLAPLQTPAHDGKTSDAIEKRLCRVQIAVPV